jgi:hypothetical protein
MAGLSLASYGLWLSPAFPLRLPGGDPLPGLAERCHTAPESGTAPGTEGLVSPGNLVDADRECDLRRSAAWAAARPRSQDERAAEAPVPVTQYRVRNLLTCPGVVLQSGSDCRGYFGFRIR